jgi:hypothetical protein
MKMMWTIGLLVVCVGVLLLTGCTAAGDQPPPPTTEPDVVVVTTAVGPTTTSTTVVPTATTLPYTQKALAGRYYASLPPEACLQPNPTGFAQRAAWAAEQTAGLAEFVENRDLAFARIGAIDAYAWPVDTEDVAAVLYEKAATHAINFDRLVAGTVGSMDVLEWGDQFADAGMARLLGVVATPCS